MSEAPTRPDGPVIDRTLVRLRPLAESDVDHILTWVNDREIVGNIAAFAGKPLTRDDELAYVRRTLASAEDRVFSVEDAAGRYIGQVGLHQIHWRSRVGRVAAIIASKGDMGRGYGTAALASLIDRAFGELQLHKVWIMNFEENLRSRRINERLGFVLEGVLREEYVHEGRWRNMVRMSILAREWTLPRTPGS